jgi:hypothetical protein
VKLVVLHKYGYISCQTSKYPTGIYWPGDIIEDDAPADKYFQWIQEGAVAIVPDSTPVIIRTPEPVNGRKYRTIDDWSEYYTA